MKIIRTKNRLAFNPYMAKLHLPGRHYGHYRKVFVLADARCIIKWSYFSLLLSVEAVHARRGFHSARSAVALSCYIQSEREALYELCARGTTCFQACNGTTCVNVPSAILLSLVVPAQRFDWHERRRTALDLWHSHWPFIAHVLLWVHKRADQTVWVHAWKATRVTDRQTWQSDNPFTSQTNTGFVLT